MEGSGKEQKSAQTHTHRVPFYLLSHPEFAQGVFEDDPKLSQQQGEPCCLGLSSWRLRADLCRQRHSQEGQADPEGQ